MAHFGRSFKPTSYFTSASRRPAGPTRNVSNMSNASMSDLSPLSSPDLRADDIVFSARASPAPLAENPRSPPGYLRTSDTRSPPPRSVNNISSANHDSSISSSSTTPSARSKPIAIELPSSRNNHSKIDYSSSHAAATYTPPAPLSARGDVPGGYFPLHEEQTRVYRPHPFQLDATKARMKSIERAHKLSSSDVPALSASTLTDEAQQQRQDHSHQSQQQQETNSSPSPPSAAPSTSKSDRAMQLPQLNITEFKMPEKHKSSSGSSKPGDVANTPVASYMPLGDQQSPLPMGKYYPSNYEQRKEHKRRVVAAANNQQSPTSHRQSPSDTPSFTSSKSESQVPTLGRTHHHHTHAASSTSSSSSHTRNESEAKRRLQQYQRDMIAQATIALNLNPASLASLRSIGFTTAPTSSPASATSATSTMSMANFNFNIGNPSKPRLAPLGSPGPVTPMELEDEDASEGYLGVRGSGVGGATAARGASSPTIVELGPSSL